MRPADVFEFDRAPLLSFTDLIICAHKNIFWEMLKICGELHMFTHVLLTKKCLTDVFQFDRTPSIHFIDLIISALLKFATTPFDRC